MAIEIGIGIMGGGVWVVVRSILVFFLEDFAFWHFLSENWDIIHIPFERAF